MLKFIQLVTVAFISIAIAMSSVGANAQPYGPGTHGWDET
jgi:hypothetical protein